MKRSSTFLVDPSWKLVLTDMGVPVGDVLRRAGLPEDLFARDTRLSTPRFFGLWRALEETVGDPTFPLQVTRAIQGDSFTPPLLAVLSSPNLRIGMARLAKYKRIIAPMELSLTERGALELELSWLDRTVSPPKSLVALEVAYLVQVVRLATRQHLVPLRVAAPPLPDPVEPYEDFLGVPIEAAPQIQIAWSLEDAALPFLTAREGLWTVFEPELRRRLAELDRSATFTERVVAVLTEGIPSGQFAMGDVAGRMAVSSRTLQRRLQQEETTFQDILRRTRETLARHYLQTTDLTSSEIAFLLGFEETSSFFRAFASWTGQTPESARRIR